MVYYVLVLIMFVLNCFADLPPKYSPYKYEKVSYKFNQQIFLFLVDTEYKVSFNICDLILFLY